MQAMDLGDGQLWEACRRLPSDWEPHGQRRWCGRQEDRPDCATCRWFAGLFRAWPDWGGCANPDSPRAGLLTFREQGCWQHEPEEGPRHARAHPARCGFKHGFERFLREQAAEFIRKEVRKANDPSPDEEPPPAPICRTPLFVVLRRLLRHADEDFGRQALDEMAADARWDSGRYWESARRFWAEDTGLDLSEIELPGNIRELEEGFWGRVDAAISEALEGRGQ